MKGKRYADVDAIQRLRLNAISKDDLKKSFDNFLDRANRCIQCELDFFSLFSAEGSAFKKNLYNF